MTSREPVGGADGDGGGACDAGRHADAVGELLDAVEVPARDGEASLSSTQGQGWTDTARVRGLAPAAHLRQRPGSGPTSAGWAEAGGRPPPNAKTALSHCHSVATVESGWQAGSCTVLPSAGRNALESGVLLQSTKLA